MSTVDLRRVLIVDDNEVLHADFRKILGPSTGGTVALERNRAALFGSALAGFKDPGFDLSFATQGRQAVELAREAQALRHPFAVAIVDVRMPPGWDGVTTIQNLWREVPDLQIILCTAYADYSWEDITQRLGRTDSLLVVKKPFEAIEIRQAVSALARKWQLAREAHSRLDDLRKAQRQVQAIIDYSPSLICLRGLDGRILLVNGGFCHRFGVARESIFGRTIQQAMASNLADQLAERDQEVLAGGRTVEWESQIDLPGGRRDYLITKFPLYGQDGSPYAIASIHTDLSRRKAEEESARHDLTMRALTRMAGTVAHDFNNVLTAIVGHHDLAIRRLDDDHPARRQLDEIGKAAQQAANLSERLLRFSRRQIQASHPVDLCSLLRTQAPSLVALLGEGIRLEMNEPQAPLVVMADPEALTLVLQDLATLTRDQTQGAGCLRIDLRALEVATAAAGGDLHPGSFVELIIQDDGPSLSPVDVAELFDPLAARITGLAGLGLSGTKSIITQLGGRITCTSIPRRGTTFRILLPAHRPEQRQSDPPQAVGAPVIAGSDGQVTILVAEDEPAVRELIVETLTDAGYRVLSGSDGQEALGAAWNHPGTIDLLVTDSIMPRLSGPALADRLIVRHPKLRVVFMSGFTESQAIRHQVPSGHAAFLQKPFGMADLVRQVQDILTGRTGTGVWIANKG